MNGNNDAGSTGGDSTASSTSASATIVEDDQQLYDWGIENRMDQYYQVCRHPQPPCLVNSSVVPVTGQDNNQLHRNQSLTKDFLEAQCTYNFEFIL